MGNMNSEQEYRGNGFIYLFVASSGQWNILNAAEVHTSVAPYRFQGVRK